MKRIILAILFLVPFQVQAVESIKIGEIIEHKIWPLMAENHHNGLMLAVDEINANGGVLGRPLEILYRNGGDGKPASILRDAEELVTKQGVKFLTGLGPDNNGLAVSSFAKRNKVFYLKGINGTNKHIWKERHRYAFRFDVSNYMYGKVFADAVKGMPAKRWAFVAPNYEFGRSVVKDFKEALKKKRPDVEFVSDQWHPTLKIDAGSVVQALSRVKPDGIFVASWGGDLAQFIREGTKRELFEDRTIVGVLAGQPEQLEYMKKEAPVGWITQGYPYPTIKHDNHKKFLSAYKEKYESNPGWFSFVGYNAMKSLAAAIEKAGVVDVEKVVDAMEGLTFDSTIGPLTYRSSDHQANLGLWVGKVAIVDDLPTIVNWKYKSNNLYYPGDDYVKTVRPQK